MGYSDSSRVSHPSLKSLEWCGVHRFAVVVAPALVLAVALAVALFVALAVALALTLVG